MKREKRWLKNKKKIFEQARQFKVKLEQDGKFVIFDVPPGIYNLYGRKDKKLAGTEYGFEIFGQIQVLPDVDEIPLDPLLVEVTPLLQAGQTAPPIKAKTLKDNTAVSLDKYRGQHVLLNFWISSSPNITYQDAVQQMYRDLKGQHAFQLLSICVDENRQAAAKLVQEKKLLDGIHVYVAGMDHPVLANYGVRAIPSFWLIDPEGKIAMSQFDFGRAFQTGKTLTQIVQEYLSGQ